MKNAKEEHSQLGSRREDGDFRELVARGDIEWLDLSRSRSVGAAVVQRKPQGPRGTRLRTMRDEGPSNRRRGAASRVPRAVEVHWPPRRRGERENLRRIISPRLNFESWRRFSRSLHRRRIRVQIERARAPFRSSSSNSQGSKRR